MWRSVDLHPSGFRGLCLSAVSHGVGEPELREQGFRVGGRREETGDWEALELGTMALCDIRHFQMHYQFAHCLSLERYQSKGEKQSSGNQKHFNI